MYAGTGVGDASELLTLQEDCPPLVSDGEIGARPIAVSTKVSHLVAAVAASSEGVGECGSRLRLSNCSRNDHRFKSSFPKLGFKGFTYFSRFLGGARRRWRCSGF